MAVNARTVLLNAATALQDEANHVRWPLAELFRYFNDGRRVLVEKLPTACTETRVHALDAGARQSIPDAYAILRATANVSSESPLARGRVVTPCTRDELDRGFPEWHSATPKAVVTNYMPDTAEKQVFWIYPPNDGTGKLEVQVALLPAEAEITGDPTLLDSYDVELPIDSVHTAALTYYVLHRAWAKDADFAANQQTSNRYYALFLKALGVSEAES